jgi:hypothetical protein
MLLFENFIGPNNVGNVMTSASDTKLTGTFYNCEKKRFTWETYVRIHTEQHSVLNGLKYYGYYGIDYSSKVCHLLKVIKTTEIDFAAMVDIYSTFIKQMKAENPQLNVSEVSFAHGKAGKNLFGKHNSSGMSNVSNTEVGDRFFEKHEYYALTPDQNNTLRLKRLKCGEMACIMEMVLERTAGRDLKSNPSPIPSRH